LVSIPYSSGGNSNKKKEDKMEIEYYLFQSLIHQGEKSTQPVNHADRHAVSVSIPYSSGGKINATSILNSESYLFFPVSIPYSSGGKINFLLFSEVD